MDITIQVPSADKSELQEHLAKIQGQGLFLEPKRLTGQDVINFLIEIGPDAIPYILTYLEYRREKGKQSTIIIKGVEYEYKSPEELETIFRENKK